MRLLKDIIAIVVAAAAAGLAINLFHPRGFVPVSRQDLALKRVVSISEAEAKIKYDAGMALFIDAREKVAFEAGHIAGAVNIPADDPPAGALDALMDRPREIVFYCDGAECGAAAKLARAMIGRGYGRNLYVIVDGFPGWEERGYPVERSGK
ncbi:MAG TPA: rhodanese-like domain-containing protein [Spirochaetota bacterium]|nr:rhodanese-like domain-containing protein [Spirochaetota bacterium]HPG51336.1 rhodanese-like domain-containing protein [Spirochaetota bacterium]HPN10805.1 rhodanese-like domain-containing protein [Spirochaetota bacterium]HQL82195.1 rhodanese-like domain-containing protein [Spirochaetota bacterium]